MRFEATMPSNLKKKVRARRAKTGERHSTALQHVRAERPNDGETSTSVLTQGLRMEVIWEELPKHAIPLYSIETGEEAYILDGCGFRLDERRIAHPPLLHLDDASIVQALNELDRRGCHKAIVSIGSEETFESGGVSLTTRPRAIVGFARRWTLRKPEPTTEPRVVVMDSMRDIMVEVTRLTSLNDGWSFLPCDDPMRACFGMIAFRYVGADGQPFGLTQPENPQEETIRYEWLPYGKKLDVDRTIATGPDDFRQLVDALRPQGPLLRCDDPTTWLVGFVSYQEGARAKVVQYSIKGRGFDGLDESFRRELQIGMVLDMGRTVGRT